MGLPWVGGQEPQLRSRPEALSHLHAAPDVVPGTWTVPLTFNIFALYLDNGYIEGKELDDFFHHLLEKVRPEVSTVPC